ISFNLTDTSEKIELFRGILLHIYDTLKIMNLSVVAKFSPFLVATEKRGILVKKGTILQFSHAGKDDDENLRIYKTPEDTPTKFDIELEAGKNYYVYVVPKDDSI
ncbi:hypothetical protein, partial [Bartonella sp. AA89HNZF]|uniref:hypothetical protein n=1 Tax=Bartonella sp. AA89HNZF TaxID=3243442 RepID=UPI0035D107ED